VNIIEPRPTDSKWLKKIKDESMLAKSFEDWESFWQLPSLGTIEDSIEADIENRPVESGESDDSDEDNKERTQKKHYYCQRWVSCNPEHDERSVYCIHWEFFGDGEIALQA